MRILTMVLLACVSTGALADQAPDGWVQPAKHRFLLQNLVVLRTNPVGLEDQMRVGWQVRLHDRTSTIARDNFLFLGASPRLNPSFAKVGPSLEIQPLSIFNLRLAAEYIGYFSTFGFMQSFGSPL